MIVQIYEVQTPLEAEQMAALGVDHIGSVLLEKRNWKVSAIRETLQEVAQSPARSSLIPLFSDEQTILRALDYYQPDVLHFCESLCGPPQRWARLRDAQVRVKATFPEVKIMRSIPIGLSGRRDLTPTLEIARFFEAASDYFLTDTLLPAKGGKMDVCQPVSGFIGITGRTCDWDMARELVHSTRIPVILAGGLAPDNVADGILKVNPAGVDSCTGTNAVDEAGRTVRFSKDPLKVRQLVQAARTAAEALLDKPSQKAAN